MLPSAIEVLTLFVHDVVASRAFYAKVFAPPIVYEDEVSAVLQMGGVMVNLLQREQAPELVAPLPIGDSTGGARSLLTIKVEDVDSLCSELEALGVPLLNGPIDRPWGRRTAAFADPSGHIWELAQEI